MDAPDKPSPPEKPPEPGGPPPGQWISPKLREKLMETEETEWKPTSTSPWPWVIVAILVVVGGTAGILMLRANAEKKKVAEAKAAAAAAAATAESLATAARAESLAAVLDSARVAAARDSIAKAKAIAAQEAGPFGIVVGQYLFEDKAGSERDRLAAGTGLPGMVRSASEGGTTVYRVILGSFGSRAAAQSKADELTGQEGIGQARVILLPK
jgi:hypothetical protein